MAWPKGKKRFNYQNNGPKDRVTAEQREEIADLRYNKRWALARIAIKFGYKDHSSVIHQLKKFADPKFKKTKFRVAPAYHFLTRVKAVKEPPFIPEHEQQLNPGHDYAWYVAEERKRKLLDIDNYIKSKQSNGIKR